MDQRKSTRRTRLIHLLNNIKTDTAPLVHTTITRPADPESSPSTSTSSEPTAEITHKGIFPDFADALEWPIIKSLYETDVPTPEMEVSFEEHRAEIDALISDWTSRVEEQMAELLRKGRVSDGLPKEPPEPVWPLEESKPNPFQDLSVDQKLLYRADSFFEPTKVNPPGRAYFFDAVLPYGYSMKSEHNPSSMFSMRSVKEAFKLTAVKRNLDAQTAARVLLSALGNPDASFLEMKLPGQGFVCGRCHDSSMKTWEEMVRLPTAA